MWDTAHHTRNTDRSCRLLLCRDASAHPGRFVHVESGPGRLELTPWKVWAWGGTCSPCATADKKQGAQPSASPFAPALLTHFDFDSRRLCFAIEDAQSGESGLGRGSIREDSPLRGGRLDKTEKLLAVFPLHTALPIPCPCAIRLVVPIDTCCGRNLPNDSEPLAQAL